MSSTYIKNNEDRKIDPCDTPQMMLATLEYLFFDIDLKSSIKKV